MKVDPTPRDGRWQRPGLAKSELPPLCLCHRRRQTPIYASPCEFNLRTRGTGLPATTNAQLPPPDPLPFYLVFGPFFRISVRLSGSSHEHTPRSLSPLPFACRLWSGAGFFSTLREERSHTCFVFVLPLFSETNHFSLSLSLSFAHW